MFIRHQFLSCGLQTSNGEIVRCKVVEVAEQGGITTVTVDAESPGARKRVDVVWKCDTPATVAVTELKLVSLREGAQSPPETVLFTQTGPLDYEASGGSKQIPGGPFKTLTTPNPGSTTKYHVTFQNPDISIRFIFVIIQPGTADFQTPPGSPSKKRPSVVSNSARKRHAVDSRVSSSASDSETGDAISTYNADQVKVKLEEAEEQCVKLREELAARERERDKAKLRAVLRERKSLKRALKDIEIV